MVVTPTWTRLACGNPLRAWASERGTASSTIHARRPASEAEGGERGRTPKAAHNHPTTQDATAGSREGNPASMQWPDTDDAYSTKACRPLPDTCLSWARLPLPWRTTGTPQQLARKTAWQLKRAKPVAVLVRTCSSSACFPCYASERGGLRVGSSCDERFGLGRKPEQCNACTLECTTNPIDRPRVGATFRCDVAGATQPVRPETAVHYGLQGRIDGWTKCRTLPLSARPALRSAIQWPRRRNNWRSLYIMRVIHVKVASE